MEVVIVMHYTELQLCVTQWSILFPAKDMAEIQLLSPDNQGTASFQTDDLGRQKCLAGHNSVRRGSPAAA